MNKPPFFVQVINMVRDELARIAAATILIIAVFTAMALLTLFVWAVVTVLGL
jgi:NADH:ubiquinone oxidoreductase subunit D